MLFSIIKAGGSYGSQNKYINAGTFADQVKEGGGPPWSVGWPMYIYILYSYLVELTQQYILIGALEEKKDVPSLMVMGVGALASLGVWKSIYPLFVYIL